MVNVDGPRWAEGAVHQTGETGQNRAFSATLASRRKRNDNSCHEKR
jgi:hypothetical protein